MTEKWENYICTTYLRRIEYHILGMKYTQQWVWRWLPTVTSCCVIWQIGINI